MVILISTAVVMFSVFGILEYSSADEAVTARTGLQAADFFATKALARPDAESSIVQFDMICRSDYPMSRVVTVSSLVSCEFSLLHFYLAYHRICVPLRA